MALTLFYLMVGAYSYGALANLLGGNRVVGRWFATVGTISGATAGCTLGIMMLVADAPFTWSLPALLPLAGGLALRLDALGAFFLVLIGLGAIPAAIYNVGYAALNADGRVALRVLGVMFNLFLLTMSLVPFADNVLTFLLMWEGMSLTSYFLVTTESHDEETLRAGVWYIAMTHAGLVCLLLTFILLMNNGAGTFADLRVNADLLPTATRNLIFIFALLGFGAKAGLIPLHVWLPRTYSAAPAQVAALMSGAMSKLGIYGLLRVTVDLLGGGPQWWGVLLIALGATTAVLGILYALMENDLKRLIAYSSIENLGLITIGVGAGLLFSASGQPMVATLALVAALYHVLNHAAFKGALFMGVGAVVAATGTRDMNRLGGLIKPMPWTALFFLISAIAIAGIPPLNGFISEWLLFQALLPGVNNPQPVAAVVVTLAIGLLALTGGLVAACFVKAFGITFLALARTDSTMPPTQPVQEAPRAMRVGMGFLVLLCIMLGLAPTIVAPMIGRAVAGLAALPAVAPVLATTLALQAPTGFAEVSPLLGGGGLLALLLIIPAVMWGVGVNRKIRKGETWGCGRIIQTPRMEYTATAFAEPLRRVFAELYRPSKELTIDFHPESKYFVQSIAYKSEIRPWFEETLYNPLVYRAQWLSQYVRRSQSGSLHGYLAYLFVVLMVILSSLLWPGG